MTHIILETTYEQMNNPGLVTLLIILAIIVALALIVFFIISVKRQEAKLREQDSVLVDTMMTKPQIREAVNSYASRVGAYGSFSMFYIKYDEFETLKDLLGEETIKNVIKDFAERLVREFKGEANIAQYEEDSFIIFYKKEYDYEALEDICNKLLDLVSDNPQIRNKSIAVSASIGVAIYPTCGTGFKELFENLELAAYIASREGGNKFIIYYSELREKESGNLEYFNEVRSAMEKGELTLYYQPIVNAKTKALYGFEALLRWEHPTHGIISPANFIPVLEQSGDIAYLARWELEQVIHMQEEIAKVYPNRDIKLSINLSVKQMMDEEMAEDFRKVIKKYNCDTSKIVLEVAQYAMFEKMNQVRVNLLKLRDLGFKIATDGLGLDFQSIAQIETKPIDILKLDKSFLEDILDNQMQEKYVNMLVESSNKTGRIVISEGIEDFEHLNYVVKNNIEYIQGYYIAKPFEGSSVLNYMHDESWREKCEREVVEDSTPVNKTGESEEPLDSIDNLKDKETSKNSKDSD